GRLRGLSRRALKGSPFGRIREHGLGRARIDATSAQHLDVKLRAAGGRPASSGAPLAAHPIMPVQVARRRANSRRRSRLGRREKRGRTANFNGELAGRVSPLATALTLPSASLLVVAVYGSRRKPRQSWLQGAAATEHPGDAKESLHEVAALPGRMISEKRKHPLK